MSDKDNDFFEKVGTQTKRNMNETAGTESCDPSPRKARGDKERSLTSSGASVDGAVSKRSWGASDKTFFGITATYETLPSGLYVAEPTPAGMCLNKQTVSVDSLLKLPDSNSEKLLAEFEKFWQVKEAFKERGFIHKRGFLMHGPPGSGKTSTLWLMMKSLIDNMNGIILMVGHPGDAAEALQMIRKIEPERPVIAVLEDIDSLVERYGENNLLSLLDGEAQVDNIVFVATTNYPELLDRRFVDRPSRFDTIMFIGMPNDDARKLYLQTKEPSLEGKELEDWVEKSDGYSIAHLKEMIIAIKCFGQTLDEATERLGQMQKKKLSSNSGKRTIGFNND